MLKVLIIDDEETTREGLRENINWQELGLEFSGEASDGLEALALIDIIEPNIIISDIKMPHMDGITFANLAKERLPDVQIIFLSGYSDKLFLKSAIKLQVIDFIEKPICLSELNRALEKAKVIYLEEFNNRTEYNAAKENNYKSISIIKKTLAIDLVTNKDSKNLEYKLIISGLIQYYNNYNVICIVVQLNPNEININSNSSMENFINLINNSVMTKYTNQFLVGFNELNQIIINIFDDIDNTEMFELIEDIRLSIMNEKEIDNLSVGVGNIVLGLKNAWNSYNTAVHELQKQFFLGYGIFIYSDDSDAAKNFFRFDKSHFLIFADYIKNKNIDEVIKLIDNWARDIKKNINSDIMHIKNAFITLLFEFYQILSGYEFSEMIEASDKSIIWNRIIKFQTLDEIVEYLKNEITNLFYYYRDLKKNDYNRTIKDIIKYINNHYKDNLTIHSISEHIFLTDTYLCLIFKKSTGNTINNYINEVRIQKAKSLMDNRNLTLYQISEKVGYNNSNYFSKVFKKIVGINPSKYREERN